MSKILYERLDDTVGWFETDGAPAPQANNPLAADGDAVTEARDGETSRRVWIRFLWGPFGPRKPVDRQYAHWQISAKEAAAWYSANRKNPPETLLEDLRAPATAPPLGGKPLPSNRKPPRGKLDEIAAIALTRNPALTYDQLAKMFDCSPGTLRDKRKCPLLATAKAKNKAQRDSFRRGDVWNDERADED